MILRKNLIHSMRVTEQKKVAFQNLQDEKDIQSDRSNYLLSVIATTSFADAGVHKCPETQYHG